MSPRSKLIYKIKNLKKTYGDRTILQVGRLQFHPGTIYGLIGPIGSGKTTLLKIMAALEKPTSGIIEYDSEPFQTNWFGKLKKYSDIYFANSELLQQNISISQIARKYYVKKVDNIRTKYFSKGNKEKLWTIPLNSLSPGEKSWINCILAVEGDPRVLMIDDYGTLMDYEMEFEFRKRIQKMNRNLGTTIILASPTDQIIKEFASVIIYMDNGHVSKIRSGVSKPFKRTRPNRK
ncbi:MAG: ATP-binding cassette domain-containing protein [Candidatus Marinimicrobia bacterium]|nr:ATP-binding cassette domain-containing protein [Candidatus Neomarinimicrobiota bacterium]